jgi:hypothetical protein
MKNDTVGRKIYGPENSIKNYYSGVLHIVAVATVIWVDVSVSWNFKHIVNLGKRIIQFC